MTEITEQQINDAVKNCKWRQEFCGIDICAGEVSPCVRIIEQGKCVTLMELISGKENKV